jgi:hypothetical protein
VPTTQGWIETGALRILIPNDKLPVTVSWNKAAFNEPNKAYSLMTDWPLGGWFDAIGDGSPFKEYMNDTAFVVVPQDSQAEVYLAGTNQEPMRLIYVALGSAENVTAIRNTSTDSKLAAFNIRWSPRPEKTIYSYIQPKGYLTKPGMENNEGCHKDLYNIFIDSLGLK